MINLLVLGGLALGAGPFKVNGTNVTAAELQTTGQVTYRAALASVNGGRVELKAARQRAVDTMLAASGTVMLALVDNSWTDTTAFSLGVMKLIRKLDTWYLVNTTGMQWRQINLGVVPKGGPLNLALVEDGANAHVYFNGKDYGLTPYDSHSSQSVAIGSPAGEATPWQGEVRDFEVLPKALTAVDLSERFAAVTATEPIVQPAPTTPTPTPTNPTTTNPAPPPPNPTSPTTTPTPVQTDSTVAKTKSTIVVADVTAISQVPEPSTIRPYRHALVTHEYKVFEVKSGHIDKVDAGKIIRVARWGIVAGQKTEIANIRVGDRVELTLELFADHPDLANFYTIDTLPDNYAAPYLLDTGRKAPAGGGG